MVNKFKPKKIPSAVISFSKNIFTLTLNSNIDIISRLTILICLTSILHSVQLP